MLAVAAVIAAIVLPYVLVATPFMPAVVAEWLTRVTPAAAFATQQTLQPYPQVESIYTPANGYYPLARWAGLAVLGGHALLTLGLAIVRLRRGTHEAGAASTGQNGAAWPAMPD